ncbi:MAG: M14 family metallopeptidase [Planctomycetes bacterium]|nr:M14 family metallopeptidase [Planctomycetota bacterium]MCB9919258.1 M14 family metallopeptidase [Planctomycetota bacterium]
MNDDLPNRFPHSGAKIRSGTGAVASTLLAGLLATIAPRTQSLTARGFEGMEEPRTVPETSEWKRTSTHEDVLAFLQKLDDLPHGKRLRRHVIGKSSEGRDLVLVTASREPLPAEQSERTAAVKKSGLLRLFVNANIHAGEVEGKEAVQILLREIAHGGHEELLEQAVLFFVPVYNPDGNDRIDRKNRVEQNGPDGGVGTRHTAEDYDLNRDFIKVDTPECVALLRCIADVDPDVLMDLHTTNGSAHGYELTYAPSLAVNVDDALRDFTRNVFLKEIRAAMARDHRFHVFDYGNFVRGKPENGWVTYDHRPRFGTNYFGLRNRIAVLSEAYSYDSFPVRTAATRAFVVETLHAAVRHRAEIRELANAADEQCKNRAVSFRYDSELEAPVVDEVLLGQLEHEEIEGIGRRSKRVPGVEPVKIPTRVAFVAKKSVPLPLAWVIEKPSLRLRFFLVAHGIEHRFLDAPEEHDIRDFAMTSTKKSRRAFEKHHERTVEGAWSEGAHEATVPAGAVWIPANQRLARVAAQLLEPLSEDSLTTWNAFDDEIEAAMQSAKVHPVHAVVR